MEIFKLEENDENKSFCCYNEKCWEPALYIIDRANFELKGECKMKHLNNIKIISENDHSNSYRYINIIKIFKRNKVLTFLYNKCYKKINEEYNNNTFKCCDCDKIFCYKCINMHLKEENHVNKIRNINNNKLCKDDNNFFCLNCKIKICKHCSVEHDKLDIINYLDIAPNKNNKNKILYSNSDYEKRVNYLSKIIDKYDSAEINTRFKKLITYFEFLKNLSIKMSKFDFTDFTGYDDYFNYENLNFFNKYMKYELNADFKEYKEYIIYGKKLKNDKSYNKSKYKKELYIKNFDLSNNPFALWNYNELIYIGNNLFFKLHKHKIFFLEFKDFIFKKIYTYDIIFDCKWIKSDGNKFKILSNNRIDSFGFYINNKKINEPEIVNVESIKDFSDAFCNKNEDIIMINDMGLFTLKSSRSETNKKNYIEETIKYGNYYYLWKINDNLFMAVNNNGNNNIVEFYDINEYNCISSIKLKKSRKVVGHEIINNRLICLNINKERFAFIDIINFEIISIIESDFFEGELIKIKENYFLEFSRNNNVKNVKVKYFNEKEGIFDELFEKSIKIEEDDKLYRYKDDELMILGKNYMKLISI